MKQTIYKLIITAVLLGINSTSLGDSTTNCEKHPLLCTILTLNPTIDYDRAMKISNAVAKYSKVYDIDPYISLAIIRQESGFADINRTIRAMVKTKKGYEIQDVITDIGMYQFNVNTIELYKIDADKFKTDLDYSTNWHFKLLKEKMNFCKRLGKNSFACYHSATPDKYKAYIRQVRRWYDPMGNTKE